MTNRVALVTGGIGGIGTAICQRLAKDGYRVVASYHPAEQDKVDSWVAARKAEGLDVGTAAGDVSSAEDSARMVAAIQQQFGPVDVIVNCAGITREPHAVQVCEPVPKARNLHILPSRMICSPCNSMAKDLLPPVGRSFFRV